jgi:hypothetical protein
MTPLNQLRRAGFNWLELLLVLSVGALLFQLLPGLWSGTLWALDVRNWPRTIWFAMNCVLLLGLVAARIGPDLYNEWRNRRASVAAYREKKQRQRKLKEEREMLERIKDARKRRVY